MCRKWGNPSQERKRSENKEIEYSQKKNNMTQRDNLHVKDNDGTM